MASEKLEIIIGATDKASKTIKSIGGALGGLAKIGIAGLGAGLTAATAGVGALTVAITKLSEEGATLQGIESAFQGFTGERSKEILDSMKNFSGGLIEETDLMKSFNKAAQLVGMDFAERLPDALQYLGKVSAATGEDMDYLLDSIVTGVGRMSKPILDNLGLIVDLEAANATYAKTLGKTTDEMTDAEKRTALMNQVMEQLATNTAKLPAIASPIKRLKVTLGDFKDTLSKLVSEATMKAFSRLANRAQEFFEVLSGFLKGDTTEELRRQFEQLPKPLQKLVVFARIAFDTFKTLMQQGPAAALDFLGWKIGQVFGSDAQDKFQKFVTFLRSIPERVKAFAEKLKPFWEAIKSGFGTLVTIGQKLWASISTNLIPALGRLFDAIVGAFGGEVGGLTQTFGDLIMKIVDWLAAEGIPALARFADWLAEVLPPAIQAVSQFIQTTLIPALKAIWEWISTKLWPALQQFGQWFSETIVPHLQTFWEWIKTKLVPALQDFWHWVQENIIPALQDFGKWISESVVPALKSAWEWLGKAWQKIKEFGEALGKIELPDWLTPGSPTPLELGLRGITDAVATLNRQGLPGLTVGAGGGQYAMAGAGLGGSGSVINITYSPGVGVGAQEFRTQFLPLVEQGIREARRRGRV